MEFLNLHVKNLDSEKYVGAEPVDRSTWISLLRYCVGQENGGRIEGAGGWGDRKWQQLCRVTLAEVQRICGLWEWKGDALIVWEYPHDAQQALQAKREAGRRTALLRWGAPNRSAISAPGSTPDSLPTSLVNAEGNEREGKEREGKLVGETATPSPTVTPELSLGLTEPSKPDAERREPAQNAKKTRGPILTDADWLAAVKSEPAYGGINVDAEHGRCRVWCATHGKQLTRKRFLNWLNKCERPMFGGGQVSRPVVTVSEPAGWKPFLNEEFPDSRFAYNQADEAREWSDLDSSTQKWLVGQMRVRGLM